MKNAVLKSFVFASLPLVLTSSAFANLTTIYNNANQTLSTYTITCPHWYVSGNLGVSHLHDQPTPGLNSSVDENGPGWNVNAGYQFNGLLGAELGYTQYHDSRETFGVFNVAKTEHYSTYLAATGKYPLFYQFSALGKLGIAYSYANKIFNPGPSFSSGSVSAYYGLGFAYSVTRTVDFVAQWASARGNDYTGSAELYSLGVTAAIG